MITIEDLIHIVVACLLIGFSIGFYLGDRSGYWFGRNVAEMDAAFDRIEAKLKVQKDGSKDI